MDLFASGTETPTADARSGPRPVGDDTKAAISDVLDAAREEHQFKSATVYFFDRDAGSLVAVVASGPQAAFLSQAPPLRYDSPSEIAEVMRMGRARFVGDTHDISGGASASVEGVSRWRDNIETGSHATLPLADHTGNIGVINLEWGDVRPFKRTDRDAIYRVARSVVSAVRRTSPAQLPSDERPAVRVLPADHEEPLVVGAHPPTTVERVLVVTAEGELRDEADAHHSAWLASVVLLEAPSATDSPRAGALLDVHRTARGDIATVVGSTLPGEVAEEAGRLVGHALRVHSLFAEDADDLRARLHDTLVAAGVPGAALLGVTLLRAEDGWLEYSGSESTPCILVRREGGARIVPSASSALVLPGDHVVLAAGCQAEERAGERGCSGAAAEALRGLSPRAAAEIPRRLLAQVERWSPDADADVAIACITRYAG